MRRVVCRLLRMIKGIRRTSLWIYTSSTEHVAGFASLDSIRARKSSSVPQPAREIGLCHPGEAIVSGALARLLDVQLYPATRS